MDIVLAHARDLEAVCRTRGWLVAGYIAGMLVDEIIEQLKADPSATGIEAVNIVVEPVQSEGASPS